LDPLIRVGKGQVRSSFQCECPRGAATILTKIPPSPITKPPALEWTGGII
jgi:hypothetical protein